MRLYVEAMKKLVANTTVDGDCSSADLSATAWLNALVGRMFVTIHANENVKEWVTQRLSRHALEADEGIIIHLLKMNIRCLEILSLPM